MMKSGLIAAALLALPGGALAFVANPALSGTARAADVTMTVGQVAIWDFDAPGTGTGRIDLPKGADFALEVDNNDETEDLGLVTLSDAGGRAIVSTPVTIQVHRRPLKAVPWRSGLRHVIRPGCAPVQYACPPRLSRLRQQIRRARARTIAGRKFGPLFRPSFSQQ